MNRRQAFLYLQRLRGQNLHTLAQQHGVTILGPSGKVNKGWAGHVIERYLGLPLNSGQSPNFGSWELKVVPLKYLLSGALVFKETMAITMIDPMHLLNTPFENSHLLTKLRRAVIVARIVGANVNDPQYVHSVTLLDLDNDQVLYDTVKNDYESIREQVVNKGFDSLSGKMGKFIQPRTKGSGHGSTSRAFYARKDFLYHVIDLAQDAIV